MIIGRMNIFTTTSGDITMNTRHLASAFCAALMLYGTARAETMTCGSSLITDDQTDGLFSEQVQAQCGAPTAMEGNDWIYDRTDVGEGTYVLHFNDSGELESIEIQNED